MFPTQYPDVSRGRTSSRTPRQLEEFLRIYLRLQPVFRRILVIAAVLTLLASGGWLLCYRPGYVSEAIVLVRPRQPASPHPHEIASLVTDLVPKPLGVADYALLMMSDGILLAVADRVNTRNEGDAAGGVTLQSLRARLSAESRLEIKTPYTVSYYPTIEMRARAADPHTAQGLMDVWITVIKDQAHEIAFAVKEDVLAYLENEYQKERDALLDLRRQLNAAMNEGADALEGLRLERDALEERHEVETIRQLSTAYEMWGTRIAAIQSTLNLPLVNSQLAALTRRLEMMQGETAAKHQALTEARARLDAVSQELTLHHSSPVADPDAMLYWSVDVLGTAGRREQSEMGLQRVEVPSRGANPVAMLLSRDASQAKVALVSLPQEIQHLNDVTGTVRTEVEELHAASVLGDVELENLVRERTASVEALQIERRYGLTRVQRESELTIEKLIRDRQMIEEQLRRDLETKIGVFSSLAESRLAARLAVANTIDDLQIITGPSQPSSRAAIGLITVVLIAFFLAVVAVVGVHIAALVCSDTIRALRTGEHAQA
jgi:hypothetical protein